MKVSILSTMGETTDSGATMKTMSAKDAKNSFGLLIDTARVEPVTIEKHGRGVVVVISVEEFNRLKSKQEVSTGSRRSKSRDDS